MRLELAGAKLRADDAVLASDDEEKRTSDGTRRHDPRDRYELFRSGFMQPADAGKCRSATELQALRPAAAFTLSAPSVAVCSNPLAATTQCSAKNRARDMRPPASAPSPMR